MRKKNLFIHRLGFPYKKSVYGKDTFCIHFIYILIDSVYKFRIFNKQFIFEHFFKKLMYMKCIRKKLNMWNVYGIFELYIFSEHVLCQNNTYRNAVKKTIHCTKYYLLNCMFENPPILFEIVKLPGFF
jgi:hypothetical protein